MAALAGMNRIDTSFLLNLVLDEHLDLVGLSADDLGRGVVPGRKTPGYATQVSLPASAGIPAWMILRTASTISCRPP